jgi:hypothetical protein
VVCHDCGNENASMNLICAYCGVVFTDRGTVLRSDDWFSGQRKWGVFAAAFLLPIVGLVAGLAHVMNANESKRSAGRLWLIAALCSGLVYMVLLMG